MRFHRNFWEWLRKWLNKLLAIFTGHDSERPESVIYRATIEAYGPQVLQLSGVALVRFSSDFRKADLEWIDLLPIQNPARLSWMLFLSPLESPEDEELHEKGFYTVMPIQIEGLGAVRFRLLELDDESGTESDEPRFQLDLLRLNATTAQERALWRPISKIHLEEIVELDQESLHSSAHDQNFQRSLRLATYSGDSKRKSRGKKTSHVRAG